MKLSESPFQCGGALLAVLNLPYPPLREKLAAAQPIVRPETYQAAAKVKKGP